MGWQEVTLHHSSSHCEVLIFTDKIITGCCNKIASMTNEDTSPEYRDTCAFQRMLMMYLDVSMINNLVKVR